MNNLEVMLRKGIEILVVLIVIILFSCNSTSDKIKISDKSDIYLKENFSTYKGIYNTIMDTLLSWKVDSLESSRGFLLNDCWTIDSCIVFNKDSSRLLTNFYRQSCANKDSKYDEMYSLAGAKIKNKWYFFYGISTVINRATYQDSLYAPLTFDELSYMSRQELNGAYTINADSTITTNDRFFDFMYNRRGWGLADDSSLEQLDSLIVAKNIKKHQNKISIKELENIKKGIERSVRPPEPLKKKRSLWDMLFNEEKVKIFESEEWKEYLRKKYGDDAKGK